MIVVDSQGSTPAKIGAKMAVTQARCIGTIGGGVIEHRLVNEARQLLTKAFKWQLIRQQHLANGEQASGMICGGEQTILLYACQSHELNVYQQLADSKCGRLSLSVKGLSLNEQDICDSLPHSSSQHNDFLYRESVGFYKQAYLIGGGHVSLALARILVTLDFDITVIEQRDNIASFIENHYAQHKLNIAYDQLSRIIPEGEQIFVFIMTHSHETDAQVLAQVIDKKLAYLGLLGSPIKIAQLTSQLSKTQRQHLHAPMGLAINSHTPEEIAISIAAELIQLGNSASS